MTRRKNQERAVAPTALFGRVLVSQAKRSRNMPTNLPAEYFEAEERYRAAGSTAEKISTLQELLGTIPKHKGTDKLRGNLRKRLSKLKTISKTKKGSSQQDSAFHIGKEGAGQVMVIGPANTGKSALVATLTNADPQVSESPYSTWRPTPGMMLMENVQIQLVDTPPLNRDFVEPALLDLIRRSDFILLLVDLLADPIQQLEDTIALLAEHRIAPRRLKERYAEQRRWTFIPLLVLVNKNDDENSDEDYEICCELMEDDWPCLPISVATGRNLERLGRLVFKRLEVIRIYSQAPGEQPNFNAPFILKKKSTVAEFAGMVHLDFLDNLKTARVWGSVARDGQMVSRDYVLHDGDVVELRI